ncbi:MAG: GNAT family N-acetyltransferase [Lachnospiraceae bacterium]|nr:GNAT family N-acetyltransferase [Lachnospiraceae bacterium]
MENSYRFFENRSCQYFPCHKGLEALNCLFCYCPLYHRRQCPGKVKSVIKAGEKIKECTDCTFPHQPENYEKIVEILRAETKSPAALNVLIQKAGIEELENIHQVMTEAAKALAHHTLYICDSLAYVKQLLQTSGFAVTARTQEGQIVAVLLFRYPGQAEDNLGWDIGLLPRQIAQVAHIESVAVLPEYWGRGLMKQMLIYGEEWIDTGKYCYLMATVSPDNPASYTCLERSGYRHMLTKEKYGGLLRRIYLKETRTR